MTTPVPHEVFEREIIGLRREIGSLKELLASQINAVEDAAKLALEAADKAATKADAAFEKRMDTTNEWRGALDDAMKRLATIQQFETLKERTEGSERKLDGLINKMMGFGLVLSAVASIAAIVAVAWR